MLRTELALSLAAKAIALAAMGLLLFGPADRPAVDSVAAGQHVAGRAP